MNDINTCSSNSHNKEILSTNTRGGRQQAGERRLNTNHCGVLAAGRRQGEAHRGNGVKGILSLQQVLKQGEKRRKRWTAFLMQH